MKDADLLLPFSVIKESLDKDSIISIIQNKTKGSNKHFKSAEISAYESRTHKDRKTL